MKNGDLNRASRDLARRLKILAATSSKKFGPPMLLRPRKAAAILGVKIAELPVLRRLVPGVLLDTKTIRYRTRDVWRVLLAEEERLKIALKDRKKYARK